VIEVPDCIVIDFLAWLRKRELSDTITSDPTRLRPLAEEYLGSRRARATAWDLRILDVRRLLAVMETCPMASEATLTARADHFFRCGRCDDYLRVPVPGGPSDPVLRQFAAWLLVKRPELLRSTDDGASIRAVIAQVGPELREALQVFLNEEDIEDATFGASDERGRPSDRLPARRPRNEPARVSAEGLAISAARAIQGNFAADLVGPLRDPSLHHGLWRMIDVESAEDLAQLIEFLDWLSADGRNYTSASALPVEVLQPLILQFCEERGHPNPSTFSKQIKAWLYGKRHGPLRRRLASRRSRVAASGASVSDPIERYRSVKYHGIFLFLSSDDFPRFLDSHWRDLHHLTGDWLDVYFSRSDFEERTSGFEILKQLSSVKWSPTDLPGILLWQDELEDGGIVSFAPGGQRDVVRVMQEIVAAISTEDPLASVIQRGRAAVASRHAKGQAATNIGSQVVLGPTFNTGSINQGAGSSLAQGSDAKAQTDGTVVSVDITVSQLLDQIEHNLGNETSLTDEQKAEAHGVLTQLRAGVGQVAMSAGTAVVTHWLSQRLGIPLQ
jgi:hypothetical protein